MTKDIHKATKFLFHNLEAFVWLAVLIYFAISPVQFDNHFTICPLRLAGFEHCPGCGLGRSLVLLLHGEVAESINMHPLGIFALAILTTRIVTVLKNYLSFQKQMMTNNHNTTIPNL